MLSEIQGAVAEFHRATGQTIGTFPDVRDEPLRIDLLREECRETVQAILARDLPGVADGLADLIYVAVGAAVAMGIDLSPIMEAVHKANMAKVGGPVRADGKRLKPPGWAPPDIAGELKRQGWRP